MTATAPHPTIAQIVGHNVRVELTKQRWSVSKAAARLGWTQPYLSRRVNGQNTFDAAELAALAQLLNVSVSVFFEGIDMAQRGPSDYTHARFALAPKQRPRSRTDARRPGDTTSRRHHRHNGRGRDRAGAR